MVSPQAGLPLVHRAADALAFISHFTEKTSEIYFGISLDVEAEGKDRIMVFSLNKCSYAHAYGVEHSYLLRGVPNSDVYP